MAAQCKLQSHLIAQKLQATYLSVARQNRSLVFWHRHTLEHSPAGKHWPHSTGGSGLNGCATKAQSHPWHQTGKPQIIRGQNPAGAQSPGNRAVWSTLRQTRALATLRSDQKLPATRYAQVYLDLAELGDLPGEFTAHMRKSHVLMKCQRPVRRDMPK